MKENLKYSNRIFKDKHIKVDFYKNRNLYKNERIKNQLKSSWWDKMDDFNNEDIGIDYNLIQNMYKCSLIRIIRNFI